MSDDLLLLFPGALGDFICFLPTLTALRMGRRGRVVVVARPPQLSLLSPTRFSRISIDRREVADLFSTSPLHNTTRELFSGFARVLSWTGHGDPNFAARLAAATQALTNIYPFRPLQLSEHASAYYARCAGVGVVEPSVAISEDARVWAERIWSAIGTQTPAVLVHPGSGSKKKNWEGMPALVARWRAEEGRAVLLIGPADHSLQIAADIAIRAEPLDRVAALVQLAPLYVGNDSGISHLAGVLGRRGVAIFGPTDPLVWQPLGRNLRVVNAPLPCQRCGPDRFCTDRLPVDTAYDVLTRVSRSPLR